jgi:hypothetical protein
VVLALVSIIVVTVFFIMVIVKLGSASPTILAPWFALGVLVLGFASTFVTRSRQSASSQLADLTSAT